MRTIKYATYNSTYILYNIFFFSKKVNPSHSRQLKTVVQTAASAIISQNFFWGDLAKLPLDLGRGGRDVHEVLFYF